MLHKIIFFENIQNRIFTSILIVIFENETYLHWDYNVMLYNDNFIMLFLLGLIYLGIYLFQQFLVSKWSV